jgi:hypothetical protein
MTAGCEAHESIEVDDLHLALAKAQRMMNEVLTFLFISGSWSAEASEAPGRPLIMVAGQAVRNLRSSPSPWSP